MTKSTITRERLEQLANFKGAPVTRQEEQELARMALAAMDSEPVGMFRKSAVGYTPSYHEDAVPLYRHAQPAPVAPVSVPDWIDRWQAIEDIRDHDESFRWDSADGYEAGWNACRAAMLAAAQQEVKGE